MPLQKMASDITHGMNVEEVSQLETELQREHDAIEKFIQDVDRQMKQTSWVGKDAIDCEAEWGQIETELRKIMTELGQLKAHAASNRQDQLGTSGNY